jgi:hypothetical protein
MATPRADMQEVSIVQIGLNTLNLSGSLRLFSEVFGFSNAGGNVLWGDTIAVQGLTPRDHAVIWWLVGAAPFFQLELFNHGNPRARPQRADWRPCDHGWVRFGLAVRDLDRVATALARLRIPVLGKSGGMGLRRLAFRDPHIGCIIEAQESNQADCPTLTYATSSVADIGKARYFWGEVVGVSLEPLENLHHPSDEGLWGLAGAQREGFLARFGNRVLEIVEYCDPQGRPRATDHVIADQGIMNLALASRGHRVISELIGRVRAAGHAPTRLLDNGSDLVGTYFTDAGCELEIFASPVANDAYLGFTKGAPFLAEFLPNA